VSTTNATDAQQRNVELVRHFLNHMTDAGLAVKGDEIVSFLHPEIEWTPGMLAFGQRTYVGRDEYRRYVEEAVEASGEGGYLNVQEIRPVGDDRVLALGWVHHKNKEGEGFDNDYAVVAGIEDGLIRTLRSYLSAAEAEKAAGDA
jgi:ketosteroid isomerase-like protein